MPSDNPFSEPENRTERRSSGRCPADARAVRRPQPPARRLRISRLPRRPRFRARKGDTGRKVGPLRRLSPLLQLLSRLRNALSQPNSGALRERAVSEVRRFEQVSRDSGVPIEQLRPAHYALCASLDDVVQATPGAARGRGRRGPWSRPSIRKCAAATNSSTC